MHTITTIGLDIAKSVFHVHGVDAAGEVVIRRQPARLRAREQKLAREDIGIEEQPAPHRDPTGHSSRRRRGDRILAELGDYLDIRGQQTRRPDVYASDRYDASQRLGEEVRASGGAGLLYNSLRRPTGSNVVAHRPRNITDIVQTDHFEIAVSSASRTIEIRKMST